MFMTSVSKSASATLALSLILLTPFSSSSLANGQKRKARASGHSLTRVEIKEAGARLSEMGFGSGGNALIAFQKYEGRQVTGRLNRAEFDAIVNADAPAARDGGYKHVEVDLDRQVL